MCAVTRVSAGTRVLRDGFSLARLETHFQILSSRSSYINLYTYHSLNSRLVHVSTSGLNQWSTTGLSKAVVCLWKSAYKRSLAAYRKE